MRDAPSSVFGFVFPIVSTIEHYGWWILIVFVLFYFLAHKLHRYRSLKQAYDPSRVTRLNTSIRQIREQQQSTLAAAAAVAAAADREAKRVKDEEKQKERLRLAENGKEEEGEEDTDDPVRANVSKSSKAAWVEKLSGASASKSGFKPYTGGTGASNNIRGPRRFGGAGARNCGPTS